MNQVQEHMQEVVAGALEGLPAGADERLKTTTVVTAVQSAAGAVPTPPSQAVATLWYMLVGGLVAAVVLSLVGVVWTVLDGNGDTSPDVVVTVFSSSLAALVGLFVKSPTA